MKKNYILAALLFFLFMIGTYTVSDKNKVLKVREVFNVSDLKSNASIKEISEEQQSYNIKVYYPETSYKDLNECINKKINEYITTFKNEIDGLEIKEGVKNELQINFSSSEYGDYISYVFNIFVDYGGAHPDYQIYTISYNIRENKIVDIEYLKEKNNNIIKLLSDYTYNELKYNSKLSDISSIEMLKSGTSEKQENFLDFAFTHEGFKVFFERYSVAPYYLGEFSVIVPYEKIEIN